MHATRSLRAEMEGPSAALHRAEREVAARHAVSEALECWARFEQGSQHLLRELGTVMSAGVGAIWSQDGDALIMRSFWHDSSIDTRELESVSAAVRFPRGSGLIGRVWETLEPQILNDLGDDRLYRRRAAAEAAGLQGAIAFPAMDREELVAVLEFYSRSEICKAPLPLRSLPGIAQELGQFLARRRGQLSPTKLTPRELEILQLAAHGQSRRDIAELLVISPTTVKTHFEKIYPKLGVSDRAAAVAKGLRLGLIR